MAEEKKTSAKKADAKKADAKKNSKKKSKTNPFKSMASFFKSVKAEGKKVVWAKPKEVLKNTIIVLIVVTIAGAAIFAVDSALTQGMKGIKKLADKEETTISTTAETTTSADDLVESDTADSEKTAE